jgi:hypothetical protein
MFMRVFVFCNIYFISVVFRALYGRAYYTNAVEDCQVLREPAGFGNTAYHPRRGLRAAQVSSSANREVLIIIPFDDGGAAPENT